MTAPRTTAQSLKVEDLVERLLRGQVRLPEFQRKLKWTRADKVKLIDSVLRGYPIGALLFWQRDAPPGRVELGSVTLDVPATQSAWFIVDGQQRIVALLEALAPPGPHRGLGEFWVDLETEEVRSSPNERSIPTSQLGDNERLLAWLDAWSLRTARPDLVKKAYGLSKRMREYALPAYVVEAPQSEVADIFDRLNTSGKPLTRPEIFRAIEHATASEPGRLDVLNEQLAALAFGEVRDETVLQAVQAVAGFDVNKSPPRSWPKADQERAFSEAARSLTAAVVFLKNEVGIPHVSLLPYSLPLVVFARFFHLHPEPSFRNRELLVRWFWRATLEGALRGDNVPLVSRFVASIRPNDADQSVHDLLRSVNPAPALPTLQPTFNLRRASTKVEVLALLSFKPKDFKTLHDLDVPKLLQANPLSKLLQPLISKRIGSPWLRSVANRAFQPSQGKQNVPLKLWPEVALSHALDPREIGGDPLILLERRAERIQTRMAQWLAGVAGLNRSDRPPLSKLLEEVA